MWDYAGDGYVHRLIQNKTDGKLVELPSAASSMGSNPRDSGLGPGPSDTLTAEKIEAIGIEYSYLLTSQLESQRSYYEEQMGELKTQVNELKGLVDRLNREFEKQRSASKDQEEERKKERDTEISEVIKDKVRAESRADKMTQLARKLEKELREERAVSKGLMDNLGKMKEKVERAGAEKQQYDNKVQDLEDQLRDVMFYLEAKTKIEQGDGLEAEAAGGTLEVTVSPPATAKKKSRK